MQSKSLRIQDRAVAVGNNLRRRLSRKLYVKTGGNTKAPSPELMSLPLIAQCNKRCNFCEIIGVANKLKIDGKIYQANIMSLEVIYQLQDLIKETGSIDFGGLTGIGEPMLTPHFNKIVEYIRQQNKGVMLRFTTNASLLDRDRADFLVKHAPLSITFSLHALTKKTYEKTMGADFERVIENIKYFCGQAKENPLISTYINFGFGKHNYKEAIKVVDFAKENSINAVNIYPYYKSPNAYMEDMSLYSKPKVANDVLDKVYKKAKKMGVKLKPEKPAYIKEVEKVKVAKNTYTGGCPRPYANFILKADPFRKNKLGLCVCNRITPFHIDMTKKVTREDVDWAWNHPYLKKMRLAKPGDILEICRFCMDPKTPVLRSLDNDEYKKQRDKAVKTDLTKYSNNHFSPNKSIQLLASNIFSL